MLRLAGCVMVFLSGSFLGLGASWGLKERERYHLELLRLCRLLEVYLRSDALDTAELMERLRHDPQLAELDFLSETVSQTADRIEKESCPVSDEVRRALVQYFSRFGQTDLEGQLKKTALLETELRGAYQESHEKREKYSKLYRVLGMCGGALGALMNL